MAADSILRRVGRGEEEAVAEVGGEREAEPPPPLPLPRPRLLPLRLPPPLLRW